MIEMKGRYVIRRTSESRWEWWTGSGWSEDEKDARRYADEPHAGEVTGDEDAKVAELAEK
jgi:hypothetical protein